MCPRLERNRFSLDLYPPNTGTRVIFIVPLLMRHPAEEMIAGARLQANQIGPHVRGVSQQLLLRELLPHTNAHRIYNLFPRETWLDQTKDVWCQLPARDFSRHQGCRTGLVSAMVPVTIFTNSELRFAKR